MTVLVDSDVLIEVLRGRNEGLIAAWNELSETSDAVLCSPVTVAELWNGARPKEHVALAQFFKTLVCVPIDAGMGEQAGKYLSQFRKSHGLEMADALIAASAVSNQAELWTRNTKHYPMKEISFYRAM